jgi:hypothetical protein
VKTRSSLSPYGSRSALAVSNSTVKLLRSASSRAPRLPQRPDPAHAGQARFSMAFRASILNRLYPHAGPIAVGELDAAHF